MAHLFPLDSNPEIILRLLQDLKQIKFERAERAALNGWLCGEHRVLIQEMVELNRGSWSGVSTGQRLWPYVVAPSNLLSPASSFGFLAFDSIGRL